MAISKKIITRVVGGITGKGKTNVNPVYRNTEAYIRNVEEKASTSTTPFPSNIHPKLNYKVSENVKIVPSTEMKKNNAPFKRSPGAVQAIKENRKPISTSKRGLKAANKTKLGSSIKKEKDKNEMKAWKEAYNQFADQTGSKLISISTSDALKNSRPARPNRVRGGSMKSKLHWGK